MPLIRMSSSKKSLPREKAGEALTLLVRAMSELTGKPEAVFMSLFQRVEDISLGNISSEAILLEIKALGKIDLSLSQALASKCSEIIFETLEIPSDRCHILFEEKERHHWALRGKTFAVS